MIKLDTKEVCDIFNDHYVNVASEIGSDVQFDPTTHESIRKIGENANHELNFDFENTNPNEIDKIFKNISTKKATDIDNISAKLVKAGAPAINNQISSLVNATIQSSTFPDRLKEAQIVPLYKKEGKLSTS